MNVSRVKLFLCLLSLLLTVSLVTNYREHQKSKDIEALCISVVIAEFKKISDFEDYSAKNVISLSESFRRIDDYIRILYITNNSSDYGGIYTFSYISRKTARIPYKTSISSEEKEFLEYLVSEMNGLYNSLEFKDKRIMCIMALERKNKL